MKKTLNEYINYTQPIVELARIDDFGDFKNSNIGIYIKGGEGFQTEHGDPHFTLCLGGSQCVRILIPDSTIWKNNKKLVVLDGKKLDKQIKKELIDWIDKNNTENSKITNLEALIFMWNNLNKTNKNVRKAK